MELTNPIIRRSWSMLRKLKTQMGSRTRCNNRQDQEQEIFDHWAVGKSFALKWEKDKIVRSQGIETDHPKNEIQGRAMLVPPVKLIMSVCHMSKHLTHKLPRHLKVHAHQHNAYTCLDHRTTFNYLQLPTFSLPSISPQANTCNSIPSHT